jgi:predicted secreted protein
MQDALRQLREEWKKADQGGLPNHALWKRFDAACNNAYKVVQTWLDKIKHEASEHRAQRLALIEEVKAWGEANAENADWRAHLRALHQFGDRWRSAGHLSEKAFAELQPLWRQALNNAAAPLEAAQKASTARRQALIAEAEQLGAAPLLRVDAVKALQQNWQTEAQSVPMDRRIEQKMWEAFRKPIDEAFSRKTNSREHVSNVPLSAHDRLVLDASNELKAANASGDVQKIKTAMAALDAALKGQAKANADVVPASVAVEISAHEAPATESNDSETDSASNQAPEPVKPVEAPKPARPLVAMRGDDRPGQKKSVPTPAGRGGPGDRRDGKGAPRSDKGGFGDKNGGRFDRGGDREERGPRLGDAAFRAQRDAMEHAEMALRKLAAQAHGESLTHLLAAWEKRQADLVPTAQDLGRNVNPAARAAWSQAVSQAPAATAGEAILRLEMAAEVPTPAENLNERRALQLQLLTRKNQPGPEQTWALDVTAVLSSTHEPKLARRLQNALKNLLRS